ncbi:Trans-enoyl reductase ccsC [Metarhizium anisopliae]|nr:Trans-enoyl reductase ccsC [Metarhizium anisopliae]
MTPRPTPRINRAIIQSEHGGTLTQTFAREVPSPGPNQVLVRTAAVALNPSDWKMLSACPCPGAGCGSDYAGRVVRLGSCVTHLAQGDRVSGAVHANNPVDPSSGAYAEYSAVDASQLWKIPDAMPWTDAAAIGLCCIGTVGMAAWRNLELPGTPEEPSSKSEFVFVHGGNTANGTMAIQLLKLSGFRVLASCSPHNFKLVEDFGAEKAFDYTSPTAAEDIRAYTANSLEYVMDIIADAKSLKLCYAAMGRAGGRYVGFEFVPDELAALRKTIKASWVLGIRLTGGEIVLDKGYGYPANAELRDWGRRLFRRVESWVREGKIRPHPSVVHEYGLDGIIDGVERLRRREVSGCKLVYVIDRHA